MRLKTSLLLSITLLFSFSLAGASFASKADELIAKGDKLVAKAEASKRTVDKNDDYDEAIKAYNEVANGKAYSDTPEAAEAMYKVSMVHYTADKKAKVYNLRMAYDNLKKLISSYDKDESAYPRLENNEIKEIQNIVADSIKQEKIIAVELNRENSKTKQFKIMDFFVKLTGKLPFVDSKNTYWLAIILVTIIVKILITPLTKAQFKAMKEMQKVAPLIKELQEKHKGDQKTIGEKTMEIYKEHKINPFASCLPILVQFPIMLGLYSMIRSYEFQFVHGTFFWIGSGISHAFSILVPFVNATVWVTAKNLSEPDLILVVLYLISMYISTKMSAVDPSQAEQQKMMAIMMPVMFAFIFAGFPAAFLLYWLAFNVLQTIQQYLIMRAPAAEIVPGGSAPAIDSTEGNSARARRRNRRRN